LNSITIICQDKYEAQKLANLTFVNDTKETYLTEILNVIENEVVLSIKDKSAHSIILMDNDQVLLFTDFIQSVIEKRQKIIRTETVGSSVNIVKE
jgi:bifunctional N-acetylglucosamine-1-phosphate-uridyltransferase/glucosamine-1-phosphate-acetyltransferase GlmU-like protein